MTTETEKLLSLLYQASAEIQVSNGWLLIGPPEIAQKFSGQIQALKPEILLALGHCPICSGDLTCKVEETEYSGEKRTGRHIYCQTAWHYDDWQF